MALSVPNILDVRPLPAARKSKTVLATFDRLGEGESFVLVDDQEPASLRTCFEAERGDEGRWVYLQEGPKVWHVKIVRRRGAKGT